MEEAALEMCLQGSVSTRKVAAIIEELSRIQISKGECPASEKRNSWLGGNILLEPTYLYLYPGARYFKVN